MGGSIVAREATSLYHRSADKPVAHIASLPALSSDSDQGLNKTAHRLNFEA